MVRAAAVNVHTARATPLPRGAAAANTWPLRVLMPASCTTPQFVGQAVGPGKDRICLWRLHLIK